MKLNDINKTNLHPEDLLTFRLFQIEHRKMVRGKHWYSFDESVLDKIVYCIELTFKANTQSGYTFSLRASYYSEEERQKDYDSLIEAFVRFKD